MVTLYLTSQDTIEYCRQRQAFGRPLLDNQYLHYKLAEMKTEVELLRAGLYRQNLLKLTTKASSNYRGQVIYWVKCSVPALF